MAYPPSVPAGNRLGTTPLPGNHSAEHNQVAAALTDIINELGSDPKNGYASVTAAIADILLDKLVPAGAALEYHGTTEPAGWVFYRGQSITKVSAPQTWARFGDTYGASTDTEFVLPDRRLRIPVGLGSGAVTAAYAATIGQTGGSKDSVLIEHSHSVDPPSTVASGVRQWYSRGTDSGSTHILIPSSFTGTGTDPYSNIAINIAAFNSANAGVADEDGIDANLPPYIVVNYIGRLV